MVRLLTYKRSNGVRRPPTIPTPFPRKVIIKRTHSEIGRHALFPDLEDGLKRDKVLEGVHIDNAQWFTQSFIPFVVSAGEIRMFFVGMTNVYSVHTIKNPKQSAEEWTPNLVESVTPLDIVQ